MPANNKALAEQLVAMFQGAAQCGGQIEVCEYLDSVKSSSRTLEESLTVCFKDGSEFHISLHRIHKPATYITE